MRLQILTLMAGLFSALFPTSHSFADPLSGEERESILSQLVAIEEGYEGNRVSVRTSAVQTFQAAAASDKAAYEFYLQCHKKLKFDAKDASFSDFRKWRESNEDRLRTKANLMAMRLQLQYLVLSLRAAEGVKMEVIVPELETFVGNIVVHYEDLEQQGMRTLRQSVDKTIFAEAYQLHKSLEMENWCFSPANFPDVYEKTVFPHIRATDPKGIGAAWDRRISLEKKLFIAREVEDKVAIYEFEKEKLPALYWSKAIDIYKVVSQREGAASMLQLLRANPEHPELKNWMDYFRELLKDEASAGSTQSPAVTRPAAAEVKPNPGNPLGFENF